MKNISGVQFSEIPALSVECYVGKDSFFEETCQELTDHENLLLKRGLSSFLNQKQRTHEEAINFIDKFIEVTFE